MGDTLTCPSGHFFVPEGVPAGGSTPCPYCGTPVPVPDGGSRPIDHRAETMFIAPDARSSERPAGEAGGDPGTSTASETGRATHGSPPPFPRFEGMEILEEVAPGVGGMGVVDKARETSLDRIVAVKTPKARLQTAEGREFFLREARAAARLDHENILRIFRFEPEHRPPFYVMQFIEGRPLHRGCQGRDHRFLATVLRKIALALAYAHDHGVIHRDIKPDNILLDQDGEPHIADFGLALRHEDILGRSSGDVSAVGTPFFMAPEVLAGRSPPAPTAALDIYSLGVTMYQLLTGRLPYSGGSIEEVRRSVLETEPPLPQEIDGAVPEPLQRICLKAMERNPAARYESARAIAEDLRRFLEGREVAARPLRYDVELRGKCQNHLTDIRLWQEQHLIDVPSMDRLARAYGTILAAPWPWHQLSVRFPWETILLRLGGWLVLLSSLLWPICYWGELSHPERVLAVGLPALAMNLAGWILLARRSRVNALTYLSTGAVLLPLFVGVLLTEYDILQDRQVEAWELFPPPQAPDPSGDVPAVATLQPTNLQITISAGSFVAYCLLLVAATRARVLGAWVGIGVYLLAAGLLLRVGLKEWLDHRHEAWALLAFMGVAILFWPAALVLDRLARARSWAGLFYAFFPLPFVACFSLLARYGAIEWLGARDRMRDETINLWLMSCGVVYFGAARWSDRARSSFIRFWGSILMLLVPLHLITPSNLLFEDGMELFRVGNRPFTAYEAAAFAIALVLAVLGTRMRKHTLALPALIGLAIFVFRATDRHFAHHLAWPLGLAVVGGTAMMGALISLIVRTHRSRERIS